MPWFFAATSELRFHIEHHRTRVAMSGIFTFRQHLVHVLVESFDISLAVNCVPVVGGHGLLLVQIQSS